MATHCLRRTLPHRRRIQAHRRARVYTCSRRCLHHIKRKGVCTVKRVTWWTRRFLVGGKRRRDGKLFTPTKAQTTHTQQVQEQKQTHVPSDEYNALKHKLEQVGYEKLTRNEKRRWNELQLQRVGCQRPPQPQPSSEFNYCAGEFDAKHAEKHRQLDESVTMPQRCVHKLVYSPSDMSYFIGDESTCRD
ncbi:MAG: hypothetical protein KatS3mg038_1119 [Candidatus Kapaibacterium sp.]|nr:MAG: hypothetical protein KatS3mg038_1119 [Candidatus Kapabacteria bacterium]